MHPIIPRLAMIVIFAVLLSSCGTQSGTDSGAQPSQLGFVSYESPSQAPSGADYETCTISYRTVNWSGDAATAVEAMEIAGRNCVAQDWYPALAWRSLGMTLLATGTTVRSVSFSTTDTPEQLVQQAMDYGTDLISEVSFAWDGECTEGKTSAVTVRLKPDAEVDHSALLAESDRAISESWDSNVLFEADGLYAASATDPDAPDCAVGWLVTSHLVMFASAPNIEHADWVLSSVVLPTATELPEPVS